MRAAPRRRHFSEPLARSSHFPRMPLAVRTDPPVGTLSAYIAVSWSDALRAYGRLLRDRSPCRHIARWRMSAMKQYGAEGGALRHVNMDAPLWRLCLHYYLISVEDMASLSAVARTDIIRDENAAMIFPYAMFSRPAAHLATIHARPVRLLRFHALIVALNSLPHGCTVHTNCRLVWQNHPGLLPHCSEHPH